MRILDHLDVARRERRVDLALAVADDDQRRQVGRADLIDQQPAVGIGDVGGSDLGGRVVVVTAKYEPNALRCLAQVGLDVDAVFGWRYAEAKGDTLRDERADVYVGDTPNDVRAATSAGAHMVAVTTGPHSEAELRDAGAPTVFDSLTEFPAWLTAWRDPSGAR